MEFKQSELDVIKRALREAMNQAKSEQDRSSYRQLLEKCTKETVPHVPPYHDVRERLFMGQDGFRYDYDDASDVGFLPYDEENQRQ